MRKSKTIQIGEKTVTVLELRVKDLRTVKDALAGLAEAGPEMNEAGFLALADKHLPLFMTGIELKDLEEFAPSELEGLLSAFREVNAAFLKLAGGLGMGGLLESLRQAVTADLIAAFAASSRPGTAPASGNTDIPSS